MTSNDQLFRICENCRALNELDIDEANGHFQGMVQDGIDATGKHLNDLTIRELRLVVARARICFEKQMNGAGV